MTTQLASLIAAPSKSEIIALLLAEAAAAGLPTTSWAEDSVPVALIQGDAQALTSTGKTISAIAAGGYLDLAASLAAPGQTSPWVDLLAESFYNKSRKPAIGTVGLMSLQDSASAGPFTVSPYQLFVQDPSGQKYQNSTGGTLVKGGKVSSGTALQLTWQAVTPGSAGNVASNTSPWTLLTPLPGVTLVNPPVGATWITTFGNDVESDASLVARCKACWPGLGGGATSAVYKMWAIESSASVARVNVVESYPTSGCVYLYCAGSAGGVSSGVIDDVKAYIATRKPLCTIIDAASASNTAVVVAGTAHVAAAYLATARAAFVSKLAQYQAATDIGGTVYYSQLLDAVQAITGVRNVTGFTVNGGIVDVALAAAQVAVFTNSLSWVSA